MGLKLGIARPEQWLEEVDDIDFAQWYAYYQLEPFGGEQELLARCAAFLQIIAMKDYDEQGVKSVAKYAQSLLQSIMPSDWIGQPESGKSATEDSLQAFEAVVMKAFG